MKIQSEGRKWSELAPSTLNQKETELNLCSTFSVSIFNEFYLFIVYSY